MKFNKISQLLIALSCSFLIFSSCAQEVEESNDTTQKRILEAYMQVNYGGTIKPTDSGIYVLSLKEGAGAKPEKGNAVYVQAYEKTLNGIYNSASKVEEIAKLLGTYSPTIYYGPKLYVLGTGANVQGFEELIYMLKEGGSVEGIVPPWLSGSELEGVISPVGINNIYNISLKTVIPDMAKYLTDTLENYSKFHYNGLDSISKGYYYKSIKAGEKDTIVTDKKANVYYIGKLLDGFIFDTNVADTARKYGIFNSTEGKYEPLEVTYKDNYEEISVATGGEDGEESGTFQPGFSKTLKKMTYGTHAITFFDPILGYKDSPQTEIPAYSCLFFEIWVEKPKKDDTTPEEPEDK